MLSKYQSGYRYCTTCNRWYPPDYLLIRCEDCNRLLRIKPQGKYLKERLRDEAAGYDNNNTRY